MAAFRPGSARFWPLLLLLLMAVANGLVLFDLPLAARLAGTVLLLFVLPGCAFINLVFARAELRLSERFVFSAGASAALSVITLWLLFLLPVPLQAPVMAGALDVVLALCLAATLWRQRRWSMPAWRGVDRRERRTLAVLAIVCAAGLFYCFANLQYGDFSFDERHVVTPALEVLLGKKSSLYALPKGPEQILLVMWLMRLTGSMLEAALRLPFALTGIIAVASLVLIARLRLRPQFALLLALAVVLDGLLLGWARSIQYQTFVFAMVHLSLYCGLRGWMTRRTEACMRYWWLSAFFAASGLLGHYIVALIAPALFYLFIRSNGARWWSGRALLRLGGLGATAALISAPFYLLLLRQPQQAGTISDWYLSERVGLGQGPFNNLNDFFWFTWDLTSAYQTTALALAIILAAAVAYRCARGTLPVLRLLFLLGGLATLWSIAQPNFFVAAGYNFSFVPLTLFCALCLWKFSRDPYWAAIVLWAYAGFAFTGFWMKVPFDQYNVALPALWLIAGGGLAGATRYWSARLLGPSRVLAARAALVAALAWLALCGAYSYLETIGHYPETVPIHPEVASGLFAQLASPRITLQGYNVTNSGWRVVAALYATGQLRGESDSTAPEVRNWYLAQSWFPPSPAPRYYFVAEPQKPTYPERTVPVDLEQSYALWGTVTVHGDPHMRIYQRRDGAALPQPRVLREEDYEGAWAQLAALRRFEQYKANQRDDSAFYALAQALQSDGRPADAIVPDSPLAQSVLNLYYGGDLPYVDAAQTASLAGYARIWGIFWGSIGGSTEHALAETVYPSTSQWFGNIRLRLYGVAPDGPLREVAAGMGELATLARASALPAALHPGQLLPLRFVWQARHPGESRYKLFVHVSDARGALAAQADDEPQAGLRPTDGWHAGEVINDRIGIWLPPSLAPGIYHVTLGLYDPDGGARLPATGPDNTPLPNDEVPLGELAVTAN